MTNGGLVVTVWPNDSVGRIRGFYTGDGISLGRPLVIATGREETSSMAAGDPFRLPDTGRHRHQLRYGDGFCSGRVSAGGQPNIILIYADE